MGTFITLAEKIVDDLFALIPRNTPIALNAIKAHLIAHRGAHCQDKGIIENTLTAFQLAQQTGCWGIELDVHTTADDVLVINHDSTLNRLWGHDIAITNLSFKQLRTLEPNIPTLAEVVTEYGRQMHLCIELKTPFMAWEALAQTLKALTPCKDYHLLVLDPSILSDLSLFPKQAILLVAGVNNVSQYCTLSLKEQYGGVLGHYALLSTQKVSDLRDANQLGGVGFVNSKYSLYRELNREIGFLFTNRAVEVCHYMQVLRGIL